MKATALIFALLCSCTMATAPDMDGDIGLDDEADIATDGDVDGVLDAGIGGDVEALDCDGVPDGEPVQCCSWSDYYWGTCHDGRVVGCGWCHEGPEE